MTAHRSHNAIAALRYAQPKGHSLNLLMEIGSALNRRAESHAEGAGEDEHVTGFMMAALSGHKRLSR